MAAPDISTLLPAVRHNLKESDCLQPCFFIANEGEIVVAGADFSTEAAKNYANREVRRIAKEMGATSVMLLAESYIKSMDPGEKPPTGSLAHDPDAREIVLFNYESETEVWMGTADILPGRELGEVEWKSMPMGGGRFSGFFDHAKVRH